jgi:CheY-like chemotaxis protein
MPTDLPETEYQAWQSRVLSALAEPDKDKLKDRIMVAEAAMFRRGLELQASDDHHAERSAMFQCARQLRTLMVSVLGYPPFPGESDNGEQREWPLLIVSSQPENRKALLHILEGLPVNTFLAGTISQAREVLSGRSIEIVFCEETLPDGSYRQLLEPLIEQHRMTRFVLTLCTGEWEQYLEAVRLGATDVLRCPLQEIEVELVLIRAGRERHERRFDVTA